ncbi:formate/nitrite transporter family protein [Fulvimarina sp. MAC8]|uniref:formate/nitrite transporter family protein n=1 Tax=Fulvimarina sp. MAC8 TaxID=3162874 RepID=UPI0032EEC150
MFDSSQSVAQANPVRNERQYSNGVTEHRLNDEGSTLTDTELDRISHEAKLRPLAVYELVRQEGEEELNRPLASLWWSGLAAGLAIGFSVYAKAALHAYLPDASWSHLVESWGYPVGFLIVILGRLQLFTEITLTATLPVLAQTRWRSLVALLRLWTIVLAANVVGTAIFALGIAYDVLGAPKITQAAIAVSAPMLDHDPMAIFLRAILAGWLMATIVWVLPSAKKSAFMVITVITYLISLFQLAHVVVGSVEAMILIGIGEKGLYEVVAGFYLPAIMGNIIGGAALFALISYGQVFEQMARRG